MKSANIKKLTGENWTGKTVVKKVKYVCPICGENITCTNGDVTEGMTRKKTAEAVMRCGGKGNHQFIRWSTQKENFFTIKEFKPIDRLAQEHGNDL